MKTPNNTLPPAKAWSIMTEEEKYLEWSWHYENARNPWEYVEYCNRFDRHYGVA